MVILNEPVHEAALTIGTTPVLISPAHDRQELHLVNYGVLPITISFGNPGVAQSFGMVLYPTGSYDGARSADFKIYSGDIYAISSGAGSTLSIMER